MRKIILLACLLTALSATAVFATSRNEFDKAVSYDEIWDMYDFQKTLKDQAIPFLASSNGYIYYRSSDNARVEEIQKKFGNRPSVSFEDDKFANLFIALMLKENIEFRMRNYTSSNKVTFLWLPENNVEVKKIIDVMLKEALLKGVLLN